MKFGVMQLILVEDGAKADVSECFRVAKEAGYDGIELNVEHTEPTDLSIWTEAGRQRLHRLSEQHHLDICSLAMGFMNQGGLKSAEAAVRDTMIGHMRRAIEIAPELNVNLLLIPFFGDCEIATAEDKRRLIDSLRQLVPFAEAHSVTLAMENTISAEENIDLIHRIGSAFVKVYYDVSNAKYWNHEPSAELNLLGRHIAQIHLKDGKDSHSDAMIGEGALKWNEIVDAVQAIEYEQWNPWMVIESTLPPRRPVLQSAAYNLKKAKELFGL